MKKGRLTSATKCELGFGISQIHLHLRHYNNKMPRLEALCVHSLR
jgi:hypothetical protein